MNIILAFALLIVSCWVVARMCALLASLRSVNPTLREELKYLQGDARSLTRGELANPPEASDFRVIRGLEWRNGEYVAQSRLSLEAIRTAYSK